MDLTLSKYQENAYTAIQQHATNKEEEMHWAIGLGEEAGEVLSVIKHKYYGGIQDDDKTTLELVEELGDTLWHICALCSSLGIDLEDVASYNWAKLRARYPSNEFNDSRSKHRHTVDAEPDYRKELIKATILKKRKEWRKQNERI